MRKNPWLEKSIENIMPLSRAHIFKEALKEWSFNGDVIDHGTPLETCELCEHEELRYHFKIINSLTPNALWVGSSCILRFEEINVFDFHGKLLTSEKERQEHLKSALKNKQIDLLLEPLRTLWREDKKNRLEIQNAVEHFKRKGGFEPMALAKMLAKMSSLKVDFDETNFPVYLRSNKCKYQLERMEKEELNLIKKFLSASQREWFSKFEFDLKIDYSENKK